MLGRRVEPGSPAATPTTWQVLDPRGSVVGQPHSSLLAARRAARAAGAGYTVRATR